MSLEASEAECARLTTMLRARTNGDDPKPGYKQNVALLRTRIAETQARIAAAEALHGTTLERASSAP